MESYLDPIVDSIKKSLVYPERATAFGFEGQLLPEDLREISCEEASESAQGTISAIDGGSCAILKTPTEAYVLNCVYCNKFSKMDKQDFTERLTFISRTRTVAEGEAIFFETEIFPKEGDSRILEKLKVDSMDDAFRIGKTRGNLDLALSMARRFCEWRFVMEALKSGADFIVMDGSLQTGFPKESDLANQVFNEASSRGVVVAGLSKSTTIYTREGYPLAGFLETKARRKGLLKWIVSIGMSEEWAPRSKIHFVKLHEGADRAYRLDVFEEASEGDMERLINSLQVNSKYFAFPGYPYALIDAHTFAKVSMEEAMHIRDLILDRLDLEESTSLECAERAISGHDVLDELH
jgi:hypothetical protein